MHEIKERRNKMRLHEIDFNLRALWDKIAEQDGELTEEDIKALDELEIAKNDKIEGYGVIIRELESEIDDCSNEMKRIKEIHDRKVKRQEWLKNTLKSFLLENGIDKYESLKVRLSFRKSQKVELAQDIVLPKEFIKVEEKANVQAIKDYLKQGGVLEGAVLVENSNLQVK